MGGAPLVMPGEWRVRETSSTNLVVVLLLLVLVSWHPPLISNIGAMS